MKRPEVIELVHRTVAELHADPEPPDPWAEAELIVDALIRAELLVLAGQE